MADAARKKQHTIEYIAIGALVVIALAAGITRFKKGNVDDDVFSRKEYDKRWKEVEALEAQAPKNEKKIIYAEDGDKTPFKSPFDEIEEAQESSEIVVLPEMNFQGMVWKSSRPQAIINNKVYDLKDVIKLDGGSEPGEIRLKDIDKDGIHLIYKGKEFILRPK